MPGYLCQACICSYTAIDPKDIKLLYKKTDTCICIQHDCCLALGDDGYGVGFEKNIGGAVAARVGVSAGTICDLNMYCCKLSLKKPELEINSAHHCLCIKEVCSLPFDKEYVAKPTCACCFFEIMPETGLLKEAPELPKIIRD